MPVELAASFDSSSSTIVMIGTNGKFSSEAMSAPVGHLADLKQVEVGTTAVIMVAFFYLLSGAYRTASRINYRNQHAKVE
jgi:hypothetical protein